MILSTSDDVVTYVSNSLHSLATEVLFSSISTSALVPHYVFLGATKIDIYYVFYTFAGYSVLLQKESGKYNQTEGKSALYKNKSVIMPA